MIDINKTTAKYLVLDLTTYDIREEENGPMEDPNILHDDKCRTTELWLRRIEPGTFLMGSQEDENGRFRNEVQHEVTLTKVFYTGVFQVTQKQYELVMDSNPSYWKNDTSPVDSVTYNMIRGDKKGAGWPNNNEVDETSFLGKFRSKSNICFDLPTEAQWEYACRAGTTTALNSGKNLSCHTIDRMENNPNMKKVGCYSFNCKTHKDENGSYLYTGHAVVGSYRPNMWGLYDMHGNVDEWCLDWYRESLGRDSVVDPEGAEVGERRVLRGGSMECSAFWCRSAARDDKPPDDIYIHTGFRLVINTNSIEVSIQKANEKCAKKPSQKINCIDISSITPKKAKYLVLDLNTYETREEENGPIEDSAILNDDKCRTSELWLRRIEPGTFLMGSPEDEFGRSDDEVRHEVTLTKAFYIGVFEITQKQYTLIAEKNPSVYKGNARPVECVSYDMIRGEEEGTTWPSGTEVDEASFLGKFRSKTNIAFDLPTEAQWEYACRAGTTTALNNGKNLIDQEEYKLDKTKKLPDLEDLDGCPNFEGIGYCWLDCMKRKKEGHVVVGSYLPNAWGLYDMHGNVYELCLDWYGALSSEPATDPKGSEKGVYRVIRGGSWYFTPNLARSAHRNSYCHPDDADTDLGFRVVINE